MQIEGYTFNAKSRDSFSINITLWEKLRRNAASLEEVYSSIIVNEAWASFRDILQQCIDKHAPLISMKVKDRLCPWLTPDVKKEINIRDGLLRKARRTSKKTIGLLLNGNTIEYLAWLKKCKSRCNRDLLEDCADSPGKFWAAIEKLYPTKLPSEKGLAFVRNGSESTDKSFIANNF